MRSARPRDDAQRSDLRKAVDDRIGQTVGDVVEFWIVRVIFEWQHSDGVDARRLMSYGLPQCPSQDSDYENTANCSEQQFPPSRSRELLHLLLCGDNEFVLDHGTRHRLLSHNQIASVVSVLGHRRDEAVAISGDRHDVTVLLALLA